MKDYEFEKIMEALSERDQAFLVELDNIMNKKTLGLLQSIIKNMEKFERNTKKFEDMVKELNGSVTRCRALFNDRKNNTPLWYKIEDCPPPEMGNIWVKDINGNETLAKCQGRAIIYPADSSMKHPEFWKPS